MARKVLFNRLFMTLLSATDLAEARRLFKEEQACMEADARFQFIGSVDMETELS